MNLCSSISIPSFNSLYNLLPLPLSNIFTIPSLPCLKNPIYDFIKHPMLELVHLTHELQTYQYFTTFLSFFTPIVNFLGLSLSDILPKIPTIGLSLLDLLNLAPHTLYSAISALEDFSPFSFLPTPIFQNLVIPEIELLNQVKFITTGYMNALISTLTSLIGSVTNQLDLSSLPSLPTVPSFSSLTNMLLSQFPTFPDLLSILKSNISLADLFNFTIPGFPAFPSLPSPLISNFISPEIALMETLKIMYAELISYPMSIILNFCNTVLTAISFSFPLLCIPI